MIWTQTLDRGAYVAQVHRSQTNPGRGQLIVSDATGAVIHTESVLLAYGARFGPDVDDIYAWMERVVDVVDHPEERRT